MNYKGFLIQTLPKIYEDDQQLILVSNSVRFFHASSIAEATKKVDELYG